MNDKDPYGVFFLCPCVGSTNILNSSQASPETLRDEFGQIRLRCAMMQEPTTQKEDPPPMATLTKDRPDSGDNDPSKVMFDRILAKIKYGGSDALSNAERTAVVEIFRAAAITADKRITKLKDEITCAHLEYCYRLPN